MNRTGGVAAIGVALLALAGLWPGASATAASQPNLAMSCGQPVRSVVTCYLIGKGYFPHQRVTIIYHVMVDVPGGKHKTMVYDRAVTTDGRGSFADGALRFAVNPGLGFDVQVETHSTHTVTR